MSKFKPVSITPIIPEKTFRAFVQTVLPTIYDDSLSYYELLNKAVKILNTNTENVAILSENQEKFIEEVTNYINSLEISIVPYDITTNFDVDTFDEMKATIANGGFCCVVLTDADGSKNYLYYSNDRYYSDSNQNRMTFNGLTNIKNADDYSDNNAPSIITLSLEKVNDAIAVNYSKKYKVATEHDIDTAFANAIAISVQTYAFSYNVDSDTLSVSDVTRDIVGAINNNRICVCKVVEENKPDVECYYSGRNSVNNAEKLVFVGNIIDKGVCVGTKTVNIDADADAFLVEGVTSVNDKYYADKDIIKFIDFDIRYVDNNTIQLVNSPNSIEVYNYYRNEANIKYSVPRLRIIDSNNKITQEYYPFDSGITDPIPGNPNIFNLAFNFYIYNDFTGYSVIEVKGRYNINEWLVTASTEYNRRLLPEVTSADNDKILEVKNGSWSSETNNSVKKVTIDELKNAGPGTYTLGEITVSEGIVFPRSQNRHVIIVNTHFKINTEVLFPVYSDNSFFTLPCFVGCTFTNETNSRAYVTKGNNLIVGDRFTGCNFFNVDCAKGDYVQDFSFINCYIQSYNTFLEAPNKTVQARFVNCDVESESNSLVNANKAVIYASGTYEGNGNKNFYFFNAVGGTFNFTSCWFENSKVLNLVGGTTPLGSSSINLNCCEIQINSTPQFNITNGEYVDVFISGSSLVPFDSSAILMNKTVAELHSVTGDFVKTNNPGYVKPFGGVLAEKQKIATIADLPNSGFMVPPGNTTPSLTFKTLAHFGGIFIGYNMFAYVYGTSNGSAFGVSGHWGGGDQPILTYDSDTGLYTLTGKKYQAFTFIPNVDARKYFTNVSMIYDI